MGAGGIEARTEDLSSVPYLLSVTIDMSLPASRTTQFHDRGWQICSSALSRRTSISACSLCIALALYCCDRDVTCRLTPCTSALPLAFCRAPALASPSFLCLLTSCELPNVADAGRLSPDMIGDAFGVERCGYSEYVMVFEVSVRLVDHAQVRRSLLLVDLTALSFEVLASSIRTQAGGSSSPRSKAPGYALT